MRLLLPFVIFSVVASVCILGTAHDFAVLAGTAVTNTGPSLVSGNVGVSPGSSVTGFPPGTVVPPSVIQGSAVAAQAQTDLQVAYDCFAAQPVTTALSGQDLGGLTLTRGVYGFATSAQLTGLLTLDAEGDAGALFTFKVGSTLTTAQNSAVIVINGAQAANVNWQVGSSATLGLGTSFVGNILALTSITATTGALSNGVFLARDGAVTLDSNVVTVASSTSLMGAE